MNDDEPKCECVRLIRDVTSHSTGSFWVDGVPSVGAATLLRGCTVNRERAARNLSPAPAAADTEHLNVLSNEQLSAYVGVRDR